MAMSNMKIFMGAEFRDMSVTIRIVKDDGQHIMLKGDPCDDYVPIYGCELREGEQEKLEKWLHDSMV
jgi:hypothetical protein